MILKKPLPPHTPTASRAWLLPLLVLLASATAVAGKDDRGDAATHLAAAEQALERREYKAAVSEYSRAAEASDDADVARQATRVAFTYGFDEEALDAAMRWRELAPDSDEALLYVAQLQLRKGDLRRARRSFTELLESGDEPTDERLLALVPILSREDPDKAYSVMRQLARPLKESSVALYAVGVMALQASDHEAAASYAHDAIAIDGKWIKPKLLYARALMLAGETDKAIDYAARIVGDDTDPEPEARLELAIMYMSAGRDDDALSQVNQILLEQPARSDALRMMAIINFRQENLDAARADFQDLLASGRYTMDALYYLARIADYEGEEDRALALYAQVSTGPHAVVSQRRASGIIARNGNLDAALDHLQRFGETHPNLAIDMIIARAQLLASAGEYERALQIYDRVVTYRPDSQRVLLGRGEVLLRLERTGDALLVYREAVKRWPDSPLALNALGYTLTYYGNDFNEAARLIRRALDLDPDNPAIIDSHGWVLYRLGRHEEALAELERAWQGMRDPEVGVHLVEVLAVMGRCDDARAMYEETEALDPDHKMLADVRERTLANAC